MKHTIALILAAVMILAAVPALGESLDEYSDTDIQVIIAFYKAELLRRVGEGFSLYPGIYEVGIDIPAMVYRMEKLPGQIAVVDFFADADCLSNRIPYYSNAFTDDTPILGRIYLPEGQIIVVDDGSVKLLPYTGIGE